MAHLLTFLTKTQREAQITFLTTPFGIGLAHEALFSNMQKITCATFNGYSLMMASYYQILRKLFFEHY